MTKRIPKSIPQIAPDFPVWDVGKVLERDSNYPDMQAATLNRFKIRLFFMQEHGLLSRSLIESCTEPNSLRSFILRWGDMTPEGQEFFRRTETKALRAEQKGEPGYSLKMYERELKKLRAERESS